MPQAEISSLPDCKVNKGNGQLIPDGNITKAIGMVLDGGGGGGRGFGGGGGGDSSHGPSSHDVSGRSNDSFRGNGTILLRVDSSDLNAGIDARILEMRTAIMKEVVKRCGEVSAELLRVRGENAALREELAGIAQKVYGRGRGPVANDSRCSSSAFASSNGDVGCADSKEQLQNGAVVSPGAAASASSQGAAAASASSQGAAGGMSKKIRSSFHARGASKLVAFAFAVLLLGMVGRGYGNGMLPNLHGKGGSGANHAAREKTQPAGDPTKRPAPRDANQQQIINKAPIFDPDSVAAKDVPEFAHQQGRVLTTSNRQRKAAVGDALFESLQSLKESEYGDDDAPDEDAAAPKACESNPLVCGCISLGQADYRGTVSVTADGKECMRWDDEGSYNKPWDYPDAGLEENYCRNPDGGAERAGCLIDYGYWISFEHCDVPVCEDSMPSPRPSQSSRPSASSVPSVQPTVSVVPTASLAPSPAPSSAPTVKTYCAGSNPEVCGCWSVKQADYRGTISESADGGECLSWDREGSWQRPEDYPHAGLEENYCRNPYYPEAGGHGRASCHANMGWTIVGEEPCDVPYCFPPPSSCTGADFSSVNESIEERKHACDYSLCVEETGDYDGGTIAVTRKDAEPRCQCAFEIWDCRHGSEDCNRKADRRDVYECCLEKADDPDWTSTEASCECSTKPDCENGDAMKCSDYAEHCCYEFDYECKCNYKTQACHLAMKDGSEREGTRALCYEARDTCCGENNFDVASCKCDFWEPLCMDPAVLNGDGNPDEFTPGKDVCTSLGELEDGTPVPPDIAISCCSASNGFHCMCDLVNHVAMITDISDSEINTACVEASRVEANSLGVELESLKTIYAQTGGDNWIDNTGWMTELSHCDWHGISCDDGHVIKVELRSNNVTGEFPSNQLSKLYNLNVLDLANNALRGTLAGTSENPWVGTVSDASLFYNLRRLSHIDISSNSLSGEVDALFAPGLAYANCSHNNFTSMNAFKRFKPSHKTLRVCDLSHNSIEQNADAILKNVPPNMEHLILSNNLIAGTLPSPLETLAKLIRFEMVSNQLSGELPDFSVSFPNLMVLDLSDQKRGDDGGFNGPIPATLNWVSDLPLLATLNLAGSRLSNTVPALLGNMPQLRYLNLSDNELTGSIPPELAKLAATLDLLDLSRNQLEGIIPLELTRFEDVSLLLDGNETYFLPPAPLSLCVNDGFDMRNDEAMCPTERSALQKIYDAAKGREWTEDTDESTKVAWLDEYGSHCDWLGITCDSSGHVRKLNLTNNGLSGKLSESIGDLTFLEVLDLRDNDIKGSIPSEIGSLRNLSHLFLSYNGFVENAPTQLGALQNLAQVHLHSNRITGTIPLLQVSPYAAESSVIADCGVPSAFDEPLVCERCTMCCNLQEDCYPREEKLFMRFEVKGFDNYDGFMWIFCMILIGCCYVLACALYFIDRYKNRHMTVTERRVSSVVRDEKYAFETIGRESVYQFLLTKSKLAWVIALGTIALQVWMLRPFLLGAQFSVSDDRTDFIYTWKCLRDSLECDDTGDLDHIGWTIFAILMFAFLLKDLINGTKMIAYSAKVRHTLKTKLRFFVGGVFLCFITLYILYVSAIYNHAIATTNTEIIINSVAILFIMEIDECFFALLEGINVGWVDEVTQRDAEEEENDAEFRRLKQEVHGLRSEVREQREIIQRLMEHCGIAQPQDSAVVRFAGEEDDLKVLEREIGPSDSLQSDKSVGSTRIS